MDQKLNVTILLLFVVSFSFAQQNVVNTTKSNTKDRVVLDSSKTIVKIKKTKAIKNPILESERIQTRTEGTPIGGIIVKGGKNPGGLGFAIITSDDGSFGNKLEEGSYTISIQSEELKKKIAELKSKGKKINGATFVFDLPANFEFNGTEKANEKGDYVVPNFKFTIKVPKEGIIFSGKLLTSTTVGLSITPTVNKKGIISPKHQGF